MARSHESNVTGRRGLDLDPEILRVVGEQKGKSDEEVVDDLKNKGYNLSVDYVNQARKKA